MCKFIGKSNERILCKQSKSKILRLYSIVRVAMETTKTSNLPIDQNLSSVYFSLSKFQLVSFKLSLAMIWQMTYCILTNYQNCVQLPELHYKRTLVSCYCYVE